MHTQLGADSNSARPSQLTERPSHIKIVHRFYFPIFTTHREKNTQKGNTKLTGNEPLPVSSQNGAVAAAGFDDSTVEEEE